MNNKRTNHCRTLMIPAFCAFMLSIEPVNASQGISDNSPDWFYPEWAATAIYINNKFVSELIEQAAFK